jgi:hypothetical protein
MKHKHILKQKNFLDASYLKCEKCNLTFRWNIIKRRYMEIRKKEKRE